MSPRPRTVSDAELLEAAAQAIARVGLRRLTLADVAGELGISPGTVVHRFGSKRGLLLGLMQRSIGRVAERQAGRRAAHPSPYATLLAFGDGMARRAQTPEALANHLAFLHGTLDNPEFHRLTKAHARAVRNELRSLVLESIEAGELARCDADALSRALQATLNGSLLQWAIERQGKLAPLMRANLVAVLGPLTLRRGRLA